ncbi:MAG: enterotoxin A family protein [Pseudomonadota bacterium]
MDGPSGGVGGSSTGGSTGGGLGSAGASDGGNAGSGASSSGGSESGSSSSGGGGADSGRSAGADFSQSVADVESGRDSDSHNSSDDSNSASKTSDGSDKNAGAAVASSGAPTLDAAPPATDDDDNPSAASSSAQMDEEAHYSIDTSSLSRNTPADPGLTPGQSTSLAQGAAVMDGFAFTPADAAPPAHDDAAEEEGFVDRAKDAIVGTAEMTGGIVVGAAETAGTAVVDTAEMAWEGVKAVNDYAGALLDLGVGWTGIDAFEGHSQRHAERSQAVVDAVTSLPEVPGQIAASVEQGWETFENNWETGNYYEAGRQIGGVGLEVATIAVPAAKAGSLSRISRVDDVTPTPGVVTRTGDDLPETVFRGDTRSPDEIFGPGFEPRGTATDLHDYAENNTPSNFVSTSVAREEAETFATQFGSSDGYVYAIDTNRTGGIDVNATLGADSPYPHEREIAIPGGIPGDAIRGATPISRGGVYGDSSILNPDYYSGPR